MTAEKRKKRRSLMSQREFVLYPLPEGATPFEAYHPSASDFIESGYSASTIKRVLHIKKMVLGNLEKRMKCKN